MVKPDELHSEEELIIQENQDEHLEEDMLRLTGTVKQVFQLKGTLSEYSYFILSTEDVRDLILFNENKESRGFEEYLGIEVEVFGENGTGFIGFRKTPTEGILVKEIVILQ